MPVIHVDTEQADLIAAALEMFEAALKARVTRVDPDRVISKALELQAMKLATVRALLQLPDPPPYSELAPNLQGLAVQLMKHIIENTAPDAVNPAWERLRGVAYAPAFPNATPA